MYGAIVLIVLALIPSTPPTFYFRSLIILLISTVFVGHIKIVFVLLTIGFTQTLLGCLIFLLKLAPTSQKYVFIRFAISSLFSILFLFA